MGYRSAAKKIGLVMRKKTMLCILAICVILFVTYMAWPIRSSVTVESLEQAIQKDLPLGTNQSKVMEFLDHRNIPHTKYFNQPEDILEFNEEDTKVKNEQIKGHIMASIKNVEQWPFASSGIYADFFFDDKDCLIGYRVRKLTTGF